MMRPQRLADDSAPSDRADVAIVGGGAAGLAAAIFAAERGGAARRVTVLDGAATLGAKILISGGGRCNVTHTAVRPEDFNAPRTLVRNVLAGFRQEETVRWFESLGVRLVREETGKLFPASNRARSVLDALLARCAALGVRILTGHRAESIVRENGRFLVRHSRGTLAAARLILATGGRSLPRTGSDGSGWSIARALGHTVTATHPALVPLLLDGGFHGELSGLSHEAELSVHAGGRLLDRRAGSLLWTHFGISGPVVLDASRHWVIAQAQGQDPELRCNLRPDSSFQAVEAEWLGAARSHPRATVRRVLARHLPERLAEALSRAAGVAPGRTVAELTREERRALVRHGVELRLPVARARGWDFAEVTAGGVPLGEIDFRTMQSRLVPGLYLVGEMLDCDGRIGGFNFQWAWTTGHLAGIWSAA